MKTLRRILLAKALAGAALTLAFGGAWWLRARGLDLGDLGALRYEMRRPEAPRFAWTSVDKRHWQVATASPPEAPEVTDAREGNASGCAAGMVRVKGGFRQGDVEAVQDAACTDWISREFPARCRTFDHEKLARDLASLPKREMDFCVDRFEYPNQLGQNPIIVVTFHEAEALCGRSKKRLCTETEWTFACEGEDARPYPYGFTRDATACVVDRNWRPFAEGALEPRNGAKAREELDRLWQAEPSGSRGACKSPFGVYDMTGNVDEWTRSVRTTGHSSVLKGGYWGPVRARCRPATRAHDEDFVAYQQGLRCCADAAASAPAPAAAGAATQLATTPPTTPTGAAPTIAIGSRPAADLPHAGRSSAFDDRDEVDAIRRARVGLACAASPSSSSAGAGAIAVGAGLAAAAAAARRRRDPRG